MGQWAYLSRRKHPSRGDRRAGRVMKIIEILRQLALRMQCFQMVGLHRHLINRYGPRTGPKATKMVDTKDSSFCNGIFPVRRRSWKGRR